ncbi:hypothetical protein RchiOBHm_Chr0c44g0503551 [Rosa chinensis]|uniref:Uncharacterized protein n=1 Tax=Rosa chinensis TaxID=74649 RepID=A0A2P6SQ18_ROSCH|nr:hypothetical protein RchiOBHm_Chr0c44g0503551 [Rosa chinensis]
MAAAARAFTLSRLTDLSLKPASASRFPPPLLARPLLPSFRAQRRRLACSASTIRCLISGVDGGGGVSDEFVSTRKSGFDRGFSVIANMLKRIEPLDSSVISKGVSDSAKDSMKQTISTMLGLLRPISSPSPLGYTLWNAEYRISLMRNFDISTENSVALDGSKIDGSSETGIVRKGIARMDLGRVINTWAQQVLKFSGFVSGGFELHPEVAIRVN